MTAVVLLANAAASALVLQQACGAHPLGCAMARPTPQMSILTEGVALQVASRPAVFFKRPALFFTRPAVFAAAYALRRPLVASIMAATLVIVLAVPLATEVVRRSERSEAACFAECAFGGDEDRTGCEVDTCEVSWGPLMILLSAATDAITEIAAAATAGVVEIFDEMAGRRKHDRAGTALG